MNTRKERFKQRECYAHRLAQYDKALDGLIRGEYQPQYVSERWQKIKEVKGR